MMTIAMQNIGVIVYAISLNLPICAINGMPLVDRIGVIFCVTNPNSQINVIGANWMKAIGITCCKNSHNLRISVKNN